MAHEVLMQLALDNVLGPASDADHQAAVHFLSQLPAAAPELRGLTTLGLLGLSDQQKAWLVGAGSAFGLATPLA
jgi:hypothetical protein